MQSLQRCFAGIFTLLLALGCASGVASWEEVRGENTAAAYHRFLRENPKAPEVAEARERLALARLQKNPTAAGYMKFRADYPDSALAAEVRAEVEAMLFEQARALGTREAYTDFLAEFPTGSNAVRATGNVEYLREHGYAGRPADLAAFAERHPSSDFAVEAKRSVAALDARRLGSLHRVGLVLEIDPATPGAKRLGQSFSERAAAHFGAMSVALVALNGAGDPNAAQVDALLTIHHTEAAVKADFSAASSTTAGMQATTRVTLAKKGDATPIASEEFRFKVSLSECREGESILFGVTSARYWDAFYFPTATWSSQLAVRTPFQLPKPAVAVDAEDHRAVALFDDGGFVVVDVSDPASPQIVARYVRSKDLSRWAGLRVQGNRVATFGESGIEVVELRADGMHKILDLDREKVGGVVAIEPVGVEYLVAGSRGILLARPGAEPQRLLEMNVVAAAMSGDRLLFSDGASLYAASLGHLRQQKAEGQLRIDKGFGLARIRVAGDSAVLFGERGFLVVDASHPAQLQIRSRVNAQKVGEIHDAIASRGRIFILGSRGLQVADERDPRAPETVDVLARDRISVAGRHLVTVGDGKLQVIDTTPFAQAQGVAAPSR